MILLIAKSSVLLSHSYKHNTIGFFGGTVGS